MYVAITDISNRTITFLKEAAPYSIELPLQNLLRQSVGHLTLHVQVRRVPRGMQKFMIETSLHNPREPSNTPSVSSSLTAPVFASDAVSLENGTGEGPLSHTAPPTQSEAPQTAAAPGKDFAVATAVGQQLDVIEIGVGAQQGLHAHAVAPDGPPLSPPQLRSSLDLQPPPLLFVNDPNTVTVAPAAHRREIAPVDVPPSPEAVVRGQGREGGQALTAANAGYVDRD